MVHSALLALKVARLPCRRQRRTIRFASDFIVNAVWVVTKVFTVNGSQCGTSALKQLLRTTQK